MHGYKHKGGQHENPFFAFCEAVLLMCMSEVYLAIANLHHTL